MYATLLFINSFSIIRFKKHEFIFKRWIQNSTESTGERIKKVKTKLQL